MYIVAAVIRRLRSRTIPISSVRQLPAQSLLPFVMVEITIKKRPRADAVVTQRRFFKKTARGKVIKGADLTSPHFVTQLMDTKCCARDTCGTM